MKFTVAATIVVSAVSSANAFAPSAFGVSKSSTALNAEIRGPSEKSKELRFGWDGTTALGGAVEVAAPARMLEDIRAAGETQSEECELFNANLEMSGDDIKFEDVIELIDNNYETQLLEFKNGDILNNQGENEGSAKVLSYAALANMDKETTLKLWGQYYREVLADPEGDSHQNIRNFMKYGWEGVPFENGIALTKKAVGDNEWDAFSESWIP
uniref:HopJ type III effector protein n=1 Tax=Ditylum brightwellii TaxID=49249 RepID=A0A6S9ARL0_9STRA